MTGPMIGMNVKTDADTSRKVQVLRALAIIAVVAIHTCPSGLPQVIVRPFVNFGVGLFLFLSGWLTRENDFGKSFFKRRIFRVLVPYVIWTVVYSLQRGAPDKILFNLLTTKACAAFYYVAVYVQFVLLTPLLCRLADSRFRHAGWLVAPMSVVAFMYLPQFGVCEPGEHMSLVWNICCLGWFTYYYLGIMCARGYVRVEGYRPLILVAVYLLTLVVQMAEGYAWLQAGELNCGSQLKLSSLASGAVAMLLALCYLHSARPVSVPSSRPCLSSGSSEHVQATSSRPCLSSGSSEHVQATSSRPCLSSGSPAESAFVPSSRHCLSSGSSEPVPATSSRSSEPVSGGLRRHFAAIASGLIQIGNFSFGIYLTHILLIRILSGTAFYSALPFGVNTLLILMLSLASVMLLSKIIGHRLSRLLGLR